MAKPDPELGTSGFLLPDSPDRDTNSDIGDYPRLVDKSGSSTDQSSLDPEQPNKPLIVEKYMINGNKQPENGTKIIPKKGSTNSSKVPRRRKRGFKEKVFCVVGLFTLLAGLILVALALYLMASNKCLVNFGNSDVTSQVPVIGEQVDDKNNGGKVLNNNINNVTTSHGDKNVVVKTTSSSTTVTTTTLQSFEHLVNIAKHKDAFQSSTYRSGEGVLFPASAAVDDLPQNSIHSGSCSQTNPEENPLWWVDLGSLYLVKHVRITQPIDCCSGLLSNFEIRVGQQKDLTMNVLCRHYIGTALSSIVDVTCERQIYGRYVSIQLLQEGRKAKKTQLTLCEVAIYQR